MHWIIHKSIFKPINYQLLTAGLQRQNIPYIPVTIPPKTLKLIPDLPDLENVYVCGAIKIAKIATEKNWYPGSFLNSNYNFSIWLQKLVIELLNANCRFGKLIDVDTRGFEQFEIIPEKDNKAFDGMIIEFNNINNSGF